MGSQKIKKRLFKIRALFWKVYSFFLLRYASFTTNHLKARIKSFSIDKLHIGCGHILVPGWLNISLEKDREYGRLIRMDNGAFFLNYNLLKSWPVEEDSVVHIAASHFIEHFDLNQGMNFTKECFRVLKKGGVIRLSCPDLEIYARNYVANNQKFFDHELIREWCCFKAAATPGEVFIAKAYDSGGSHKWFYDFASLKHILETAGFQDVVRRDRLTGTTPNLSIIEPDKRELETVYVEAIKR
ncbi:MAG: hypothetical protein WC676_07875 [Candidatus Omnitrophota bacterium]